MFQLIILSMLLLFVVSNHYDLRGRIAVNEHLFIDCKSCSQENGGHIRYHCLSNEQLTYKKFEKYMTTIGIGKAQTRSQSYFVIVGKNESMLCMSKINIDCNNINEANSETVCFNHTGDDYIESYIVVIDQHGRYAISCEEKRFFFYDLLSLKHSIINITWPNCTTRFIPSASDVSNQFVYIIGYCMEIKNDSIQYFHTIVYLLSISFENGRYEIKFHDLWIDRTLGIYSNLSRSSISVNDDDIEVEEKILVGIPTNNIVHLLVVNKTMKQYRLRHISFKQIKNNGSKIIYGTNVVWLNRGQYAVVSYDEISIWHTNSGFFVYNMTNNSPLTDDTRALSKFPSYGQQYPDDYKGPSIYVSLIATLNNPSNLYIYSSNGDVLILFPSKKGYFTTSYKKQPEDYFSSQSIFFLSRNTIPCPINTYKNSIGIWSCSPCNGTVTNTSQLQSLNVESINLTCPQCLDKESCPLQFAYEVVDYPDIEQNIDYPTPLEMDVFDDIILYQMFRTDCHWNSPFYISLICLFIILFLSILISLLKFYKQSRWHHKHLTKLIRHLDLIAHGQLWFGGLLTIVVFILVGFAVKFSYIYHNRYPIEKQTNFDNDACLYRNQLNAKFETTLQLVGSSVGQYQEIVKLLDSQQFTLHIELINTFLNIHQLTFQNNRPYDWLTFSYKISGRVFHISSNLTAHNSIFDLIFDGNETIDAIRIGINGPAASTTNNYLQKLNFSKVFHREEHILKEYPIFNLQLTKVINITEGLTYNDETTYSGVWLPTFTYDLSQIFENKNLSKSQRQQTVISLSISETPFFVRNKQQPVAKRSEIIFKTIIFATICLDFICLTLLLSKLWLLPIVKLLISKLSCSSTNVLHRLFFDDNRSLEEEVIALKHEIDSIKLQLMK